MGPLSQLQLPTYVTYPAAAPSDTRNWKLEETCYPVIPISCLSRPCRYLPRNTNRSTVAATAAYPCDLSSRFLCEGFLVRLWGRVLGRRRHRVPGAAVPVCACLGLQGVYSQCVHVSSAFLQTTLAVCFRACGPSRAGRRGERAFHARTQFLLK